MNDRFSTRVVDFVGSRRFFIAIMVLFGLQALWIAFSGRFPMAFDEDVHLGIIQIYAHHLSPFLAHQPAGADAFGAVARDPSYLYHYLMSFPWRLITIIFHNPVARIISLRVINIAFFGAGLVFFRQLLLKTKASRTIVNVTLLFFVLTPLVPQVAAQINYDNLLMLLVPVCLLLTWQFVDQLRHKHFNISLLSLLLGVALLTSLVKYAFLPILLAIVLYIGWHIYWAWQAHPAKFGQAVYDDHKRLTNPVKVSLLLFLLVASGLFSQRYGVNLVKYHTPTPECNQVLSITQCQSYGAWNRNYLYTQNKPYGIKLAGPIRFSFSWARKIGFNLMFALNGSASGFSVGKPLPLPRVAARTVAYTSPVMLLLFWRKLYKNRALRLFGLITLVYVTALWLQNYADYLHVGQEVGIQGRYLFPVLLFVYLAIAMAWAELVRSQPRLKLVLAGVFLFCFVMGGGALTFILHSDKTWYWQNSRTIHANQAVQRLLGPVIPGSHF